MSDLAGPNGYELSQLTQEQTQEIHRDRVASVYFGASSDEFNQVRTRRRIDWMVATASPGSRVLDIGCGEGVAAVQLAQLGCPVEGIDISEESVGVAAEFAAREVADGPRPLFRVDDLFAMTEIVPRFDVVMMGEVIEHVYEPAKMLRRAVLALDLGGRLVVTTPYGYAPAPDHHQTFTLGRFLECVPTVLECESLDVIDGYIRFVGRKVVDPRSELAPPSLPATDLLAPERLLAVVERAALEAQIHLRGAYDRSRALLDEARDMANRRRDEAVAAGERATRARAQAESLAELLDTARRRAEELVQQRDSANATILELRHQLASRGDGGR